MEMARATTGFLVEEAEVKRLLVKRAALMWCDSIELTSKE